MAVVANNAHLLIWDSSSLVHLSSFNLTLEFMTDIKQLTTYENYVTLVVESK
jgi:hypothetical protein